MKEYTLNFKKHIERSLTRRTSQLFFKWLEKQQISIASNEHLRIDYEKVENYSRKIYTLRYKGKLVLRRFNKDLEGLSFRFEVYY